MNDSTLWTRANLYVSALLLVFGFIAIDSNAQTMTGVEPASYNEGSAPIVLYPNFGFTGGSNYGGGYMLFDISNGDSQDQLGILSDPNPNAVGAISVQGTGVFLGNGSGSDIIGSIDGVQNGQNGQDLRINFTSNFQNPSFENGLAGWQVFNQNVNLGVTQIGGYTTPETGTYPSSTVPPNDDAPGSMSYFSGVDPTQSTEGNNSLRIWSSGISAVCDVIHGGYAISDPFNANAGDQLFFDWRAFAGGDAYDVFGYLLNVNTGAVVITIDATGSGFGNTNWATETVNVPSTGVYSFVFVSGTWDATCGTVLGASLYIDNFIVANNLITPSAIEAIGQRVTYENTCGTSDATRNMEVTVENAVGVQTSQSSTIAVVTQSPGLTCPSDLTSLSSIAGACGINVAYGAATANDPCISNITYSIPSGSFFPVGTTVVTVTAEDTYGNQASCLFNVTVNDMTDPVFTNCPASFNLDVFTNECVTDIFWPVPTATDDCGFVSVVQTSGIPQGTNVPPGTYPVTYTATDEAGNTATCSFNVNVIDTEDPVIINCPYNAQEVFVDDMCDALLPDYAATLQADDNCGYTWSQVPAAGTVYTADDMVTVTVTATDDAGNASTCVFDVVVEDTIAPTIECPDDIMVENDPNECGAEVDFEVLFDDNCPLVSSPTLIEYSTPGTYTYIVPSGVTEIFVEAFGAQGGNGAIPSSAGGLGGSSSGTLAVTPGDVLTIYVGGQGTSNTTNSCTGLPGGFNGGGDGGSSTNGCPSQFAGAGGGGASDVRLGGVALSDRVIVAGGGAGGGGGTSSQPMQGGDGGGLTGGDGRNLFGAVGGGKGGSQTSGGAGGTDNGAGGGPSQGDSGTLGNGGNGDTYDFGGGGGGGGGYYGGGGGCGFFEGGGGGGSNYIGGVSAPMLSQLAGVRTGDGLVRLSFAATGGLVQTEGLPSGSLFPVGTTTNTFVVFDGSGNTATCSFQVTVEDTQAPTVSCPANVTVVTSDGGETGDCVGQYDWDHPTADDNCGLATYVVTYTNPDGTIDGPFDAYSIENSSPSSAASRNFEIGETTVTYYVEDANGNDASCSFTVTATDNEDPVFQNCPPAGFVVDVFTNNCQTDLFWPIPTATDNCSVTVTQIAGPAFGSPANPGMFTITYEAEDAAGNTELCTFTIDVQDTENPIISNCPFNNQEIAVDDNCEAFLPDYTTEINAFDNCGNYTTTQVPAAGDGPHAAGDVVSVVITVTDDSGNSSTCEFDVDVIDEIDPTIECPDDIVVSNDAGVCGAVVEFEDPVIDDNCPLPTSSSMEAFGYTGTIETWTVPAGVTSLTIQAAGAQGSDAEFGAVGGLGASITGEFTVTPGQVLNILVGEQGEKDTDFGDGGGGGGGTFVWDANTNQLLIAAGGGGGAAGFSGGFDGAAGSATETPTAGLGAGSGAGGIGGNGGNGGVDGGGTNNTGTGAGGTGWFSNGANGAFGSSPGFGGVSPLNGGQGGLQGPQDGAGRGGFGGGGGHGGNDGAGGGGGGYNGGGGGNSWTGSLWGSGGGGGSFNGGTNQTNVAGTNGGNGQLMITYSGTAALVQTEGLPSGSVFPVGTTVNTFVVTDASGNTATCSFEVTVTDDQNPDLTCPANATVVTSDGGETGDCAGQLDWDHPVASDNCGIEEYVVTYTNPDGTIDGPFDAFSIDNGTTSTAASRNFEVGVTTVTYYVVDIYGNENSCEFTVTATDDENPSFVNCPPAGQVVEVFTNDCTADGTWPIPIAEDNCEVTVTQTGGPIYGDPLSPGTYTVTYTATDAAGLTAECEFDVVVIDTENPVLKNCPFEDQILSVDENCEGELPDYTNRIQVDENCDGVTVTQTPAAGTIYVPGDVVNVTITAEDASGNTTSCSFDVLVQDNTPPSAICNNLGFESGFELTYNFENGTQGWTTGNEPFTVFGIPSIPSTWALSTQTAGSTPVTLGTTWFGTPNNGDLGAESSWIESPSIPVGNVDMLEVNFDSYTSNESGYPDEYDVERVEISVNGGPFVELNNGFDPNLHQDSDQTFRNITYTTSVNPGDNIRLRFSYDTGDDCCGTEDIIGWYIDNVQITGGVMNPMAVSLDENGEATISVADIDGGSSDNCGIEDISLNITDFNCTHIGSNTVTMTVTDINGNVSTCTSEVVVVDDLAPEAECNDLSINLNEFGNATITVDDIDNGSTDNCAIVSMTIDQDFFDCEDIGDNTVTLTVTDTYGNTSTCTSTVTVSDVSAPTFVNCPTEMIMIGNDPDQCSGKLNWSIPVADDNCEVVSIEQTMGPAVGSEVPVCELITIEYTATDGVGQTVTCSFEILVIDTQKPEFDADIVMPGNITVECDAVPEPFVLTNDDVNDNCTLPEDLEIVFTEESTQGDDPAACDFYTYTITRTWEVTDEACAFGGGSNTLTHVQIIEVEDTTPPDAVCMDITLTLDIFGQATIVPEDLDGGSTDNCAEPEFLTFTADQLIFSCEDLGENEVVLTVTDPCGNSDTCIAIVTVVEGLAPCEPEYDIEGSDPCLCLNNATTLENGQFGEFIQILSLAGQSWTVESSTGLFLTTSPAPPAAPIPVPAGTAFTVGNADGVDNDNDGMTDEFDEQRFYTLEARHVDGDGYEGTFTNGIGGTIDLSNTCFYPTPIFPDLDDPYGPFCQNTDPFEILVVDLYGAEGEAIEILVNGVPTNIFDPGSLGEGFHTITAIFDAGDPLAYTIVNGVPVGPAFSEEEAQADSGCEQPASITVQVVGTPTQVTCNNLIQVSLEDDCLAEINPDMVLEGTYLCYDDYFVDIDYPFGTTQFDPPNQIDGTHVGMTLTFTLNHINSGNMCWGEIQVEDKLAPELTCPPAVELTCVQDQNDLLLTGEPFVTDCSDFTVVYNDDTEQFTCAEDPVVAEIITRTWIAADEWGNADTCLQTITIVRPELEDLDLPENTDVSCLNADDLTPDATGWPQLDGVDLTDSGSGACNIGVSYSDQVVNQCENIFYIRRIWTITDLCPADGGNPVTIEHEQFIYVIDVYPTVTLTAFEYDPINDWYVISANGDGNGNYASCVAEGPLPLATIEDGCNSIVSVTVNTPVGPTTNGGLIPAPGLEQGVHVITYVVEDACGNVTEQDFTIFVYDNIAPVPICDEITDVNLSSDGLAIVEALTFDDGSYDNCCLDNFEVRRMDGDCQGNPDDFGPTVTFCCEDVAAGEPVMVVFRAYDCEGNFNDCMVSVNVNDKQPPILITCPAPTSITCDDYLDNYAAGVEQEDFSVLDGFGGPVFQDNCEVLIDTSVTVNIDNCNEGPIVRTWTATDASGNGPVTCSQTIFVMHVSDWVVEFPADVTAQCVDGQLPDLGEPEVFFDECELIATSFEDVYFYVVPDACYKIERYWSVINWCVFDEFGEDVYAEISEQDLAGFQDWDGDGDDDERTFKDGVNDGPGPDGYISYVQIIKVIDEDDPEFTVPAIDGCIVDTDCDTDIVLPYPDIMDDCSPEFDVDITGDLGDYNDITADVTVPNIGVGVYSITYAVTDNCGNTAYLTFDLEVEDCKLPTPYCEDLIIEIMQTGMVDVWAEDFDAGSFDNCGPVDPSFSATDPDADGLTFTCDDLGEQEIEVYFHDIYGNVDFCIVTLDVQDNMGHCPGTGDLTVAGEIETEQANPVEDVMVDVNGGLFSELTDNNGAYNFNVPAGGDYTISAMLDEDADNGVTTWDMVLITRHILNVDPLDSPYQMIAADANNTGNVSTLDLVAIRKVILFLETSFPNNTSWRFVDSDYIFPEPTDPWSEIFPEVISYNNLAVSDLNADFVGVKIGDVNGSAVSNSTMTGENRTMIDELHFRLDDMELERGETQRVTFRGADQDILGYQFTLEYETSALELVDFEPGVIEAENFGFLFTDEGVLTTSWNVAEGRKLGADEELFTLVFKAKESGRLSEMLQATGRYTAKEAYRIDGEYMNVNLLFSDEAVAQFKLYQNVPNPFEGMTTIGFHLPEATQATLRILDAAGKEVRLIHGQYDEGYNEIRINDLDVPAGVLYYRLDTPTHTATRKMVILD